MNVYILLTSLLGVVFILFAASIIIDQSKFSGINFKGLSNDFCSKNHTGFDELVCKNQLKKKKFIWLFIDGLSYGQLYHLIELKQKKKIALVRVSSDIFLQSGALHEMLLTGKFSRNFIGDKIEIDYMLKQAKQNGYQMSYVGTSFPVTTLDDNAISFKNKFMVDQENNPFEKLCPNYVFESNIGDYYKYDYRTYDKDSVKIVIDALKDSIKDSASIDNINKCMEGNQVYDGKNSSSSLGLVYYTSHLDHVNHAYYRYHPKAIGSVLMYEQGLISLMKWIDENPDYLLIVTSDHGGQLFHGEDNFCNHGCPDSNKTNAAIMMIYYNNISVSDNLPETISYYDVAPTIAQLIENVNIPLESKGFPVILHNELLLNLVSVRSKEVQVIKLLEKYIERNGKEKDLANVLLSKLNGNIYYKKINEIYQTKKIDSLNNSHYDDYKQYVENYQGLVVNSLFKTSSNLWILLLILALIIKFIYLLYLLIHKSYLKLTESLFRKLLFCFILFSLLILNSLLIFTENSFREVKDFIFISLIVIFTVFYYFSRKISNELKSNNENNTALYFFFTISLGLISFLIPQGSFIKLRILYTSLPDDDLKKNLNFILYLALFVFCMIIIKGMKYSKYTIIFRIYIRQDIIFYILQIVILYYMYYYDKIVKERNYTTSLDEETQLLAKKIYYYLLVYSIFISLNLSSKAENGKVKYNSCKLLILTIIPFTFFLCDVFERLYIIILILPSYYFISLLIRKYKKNLLIKLLLMICMIRYTDIFFNIMNGTFAFDVSLDAGNKTISYYPDDNTVLSGFFFGVHKIKVYLMMGSFVLGNLKFRRYELNELGTLFFYLIDISSILSIIFYFYFLNYDVQELILNSFMIFSYQIFPIVVVFAFLLIGAISSLIRDSIYKIFMILFNRKTLTKPYSENITDYQPVNIEIRDVHDQMLNPTV